MKDEDKTKEQLMNELGLLYLQPVELETSETSHQWSDEMLRSLFNSLPIGIYILHDGKFAFTNARFHQLIGYSEDELSGMDALGLVFPEDRNMVRENAVKMLKGERSSPYEYRALNKDGETKYAVETVASIEYMGRRAALGGFMDITERKRAMEKLEHLNLVLHSIRNINQLIVREKKRDGLIKGACKCLVETRGYYSVWIALLDEFGGFMTAAEAGLGRDFLPVVEHLKRGGWTNCGREALRQPDVLVTKDPLSTCADCLLVPDNHSRTAMSIRLEYEGRVYGLLCVSIPAEIVADDEERSLLVKLATDLSSALHSIESEEKRVQAEEDIRKVNAQLKEAMVELKTSQAQLFQSAKLAAIGELVSGVAHELNNPLGAISMYSELLLEEVDNEGTKEYLQVLSGETERAISIVKNLLSFARKHEPEKSNISVNESLVSTVELRAYELNLSNIKMTIEADPDLPKTMADFHQLQQVFLNIITNAEQTMKEAHGGGNLVIRTQKVDEMIQITFADDGPGIPADKLDRIFEPFFTTKDVGKGTGLGLSICYGIIQEHGGQIYAESTEGNGATFVIEIPIIAEAVGCTN